MLKQDFFKRDTKHVAKELLGAYLVKNGNKFIITETEAYIGPKDKANHASGGKTDRNKVMFKEAGYWYVYLIYGIHNMLNIVTEEKGYPAAVLIRGVEGYDGPGKLTKALDIDKSFNNKLANKNTDLWIKEKKQKINNSNIKTTSRIGVDYAEEWSDKPLRFVLKNNSICNKTK